MQNQEMSSLRALRKRVRETDRMAQANSYGAQLEAADSLLEPNLSQNGYGGITFHTPSWTDQGCKV